MADLVAVSTVYFTYLTVPYTYPVFYVSTLFYAYLVAILVVYFAYLFNCVFMTAFYVVSTMLYAHMVPFLTVHLASLVLSASVDKTTKIWSSTD